MKSNPRIKTNYEPPAIIPLGKLAAAEGGCVAGPQVADQNCGGGNNNLLPGGCVGGNSARYSPCGGGNRVEGLDYCEIGSIGQNF